MKDEEQRINHATRYSNATNTRTTSTLHTSPSSLYSSPLPLLLVLVPVYRTLSIQETGAQLIADIDGHVNIHANSIPRVSNLA